MLKNKIVLWKYFLKYYFVYQKVLLKNVKQIPKSSSRTLESLKTHTKEKNCKIVKQLKWIKCLIDIIPLIWTTLQRASLQLGQI